MKSTNIKSAEELSDTIDAHWKYLKEVLETHQEDTDIIDKIGFHYMTAFLHGYKHGTNDI